MMPYIADVYFPKHCNLQLFLDGDFSCPIVYQESRTNIHILLMEEILHHMGYLPYQMVQDFFDRMHPSDNSF